jgi:hypothetical protein
MPDESSHRTATLTERLFNKQNFSCSGHERRDALVLKRERAEGLAFFSICASQET